MKSTVPLSLSFALASSLFLLSGKVIPRASAESVQAVSSYNHLPLTFEANLGQTNNRVRFLARGSGYTLFLTKDEAVFALAPAGSAERSTAPAPSILRTRFVGANVAPTIAGVSRLLGKSNYFLGSYPCKWRVEVTTYSRLRHRTRYPSIYP